MINYSLLRHQIDTAPDPRMTNRLLSRRIDRMQGWIQPLGHTHDEEKHITEVKILTTQRLIDNKHCITMRPNILI